MSFGRLISFAIFAGLSLSFVLAFVL